LADAFLKMLPFLWAGAFLPTWASRVILLLGTNRPVVNASAYVLGNAAYRFALGFGLLFLFSSSAVREFLDSIPALPPTALLALGLGICGLGIWSMTRPAPSEGSKPDWLRIYEGLPPLLIFAYGALGVASPGIQYVYFFGGVGALASEGLPAGQEILLLVVYVALLQTMLIAPIVIYVVYRDRADRVFDSMKSWLSRRGGFVIGLVLLGFGILFVVQAWRTWPGVA
jgi:hypothetical protein